MDHAKFVFQECDCKNLRDYHAQCLLMDVLILASVFEEFRKVCYATYRLDCTHFYTASNLCGEAFLTVCNAEIEVLKDRERLEMAKSLTRGGNFSVFAKRNFEANNKSFPTHDPSAKQIFRFIGANNLYGGIME